MIPNRKADMAIAAILTYLQIFALSALTLIDFIGLFPVADFLVRPDGSQQDPSTMLPMEQILVSMIAFPFTIIVMALLLVPRKYAMLVAVATHGCYTLHQLVFYSTWQALFHPKASITMEFLIITKVFWMVVSLYVWRVECAKEHFYDTNTVSSGVSPRSTIDTKTKTT